MIAWMFTDTSIAPTPAPKMSSTPTSRGRLEIDANRGKVRQITWQVALLGYALVGLGCSNVVPVLFTSVGRQTIMPESVAVPAITTLGYAGILVGPAAIGFAGHAASLSAAFLVVALLLLGVAASGRMLREAAVAS
jgi:hypothetical protein